MGKKSLVFLISILLSACSTIPSFHDTISSDYEKIEKTDITLSKAFAECEVLGETARGKMVTDKLNEVDAYWKKRNIVVDKCMTSKGFKLK
jgi:starvation-inducible outer membrane lipoprotein